MIYCVVKCLQGSLIRIIFPEELLLVLDCFTYFSLNCNFYVVTSDKVSSNQRLFFEFLSTGKANMKDQ